MNGKILIFTEDSKTDPEIIKEFLIKRLNFHEEEIYFEKNQHMSTIEVTLLEKTHCKVFLKSIDKNIVSFIREYISDELSDGIELGKYFFPEFTGVFTDEFLIEI